MNSDLRKVYWFSLPGTVAALVLLAGLGRIWEFSPLFAGLSGLFAAVLIWFFLPMLALITRLRRSGRPLSRPLMLLWLLCFDFLGVPRQLMIELNNRLNCQFRAPGDRCMVMVPRCLQWYECRQNVTENPKSCKDCGRCEISEIREICRRRGVPFSVEAGGSSARNQLSVQKPHLVVVVACQREILAGITDSPVPVIAILIKPGSSPCRDSRVSAAELDWRLAVLTGEGC